MEIKKLAKTLEDIKKLRKNDTEYWSARDLYPLLGYAKWQNFQNAIERAKKSCKSSKHNIKDHFTDASKMVEIGSASKRKVEDYEFTRYACYLNRSKRKVLLRFHDYTLEFPQGVFLSEELGITIIKMLNASFKMK